MTDDGLVWRPLTEADLPAWHRLEQAIEVADGASERYTEDDLRDELTRGSWKDPQRDTLVGVDSGGVPRAFGLAEFHPGATRSLRAYCWGGVDPDWRGRGIGRRVLDWQLGRARELVAAADQDLPALALVHVKEGLTSAERLVRRAGMKPVRYYSTMRRPLTVSDAPPLPDLRVPDGLHLVPYEAALDEAVRLAHNETFADHWGSEPRTVEDWATWTTGHRDFRGDWSHVVLDGDEVAAYTLSSAYRQDWEAQGYTEGWTGLVGVRRDWRRRGLGALLLATAMRSFAGDGMEYAGLDVDTKNLTGALGLYTRLGYEARERQVAWALDL